MRKRTKRMAGLALAVMMAAGSMTACGGQKETPSTAAPAAADTKEAKAEESKAEDTASEAAGETLELSWYLGEPESHAWSQVSYDIAKAVSYTHLDVYKRQVISQFRELSVILEEFSHQIDRARDITDEYEYILKKYFKIPPPGTKILK